MVGDIKIKKKRIKTVGEKWTIKWNTKLIEEKPVVYLGVTIKQKLRDCV